MREKKEIELERSNQYQKGNRGKRENRTKKK